MISKRLSVKIKKLAGHVAKVKGKHARVKATDIEKVLKDLAMLEARRISSGIRYEKYPTFALADYATDLIDKDLHLLPKKPRNKK